MPTEPIWLTEAKKYIGTKEIPGASSNPVIVLFWKIIKLAGIKEDATPWCASFVGAVLENVGIRSTRSGLAKSYLDWGVALKTPQLGCIVVFTRKGGGHVGFVVGKDKSGNLYVLGGNQSDEVNVKLFKTDNIVGYRWPSDDKTKPEVPILATAASFETKVT